MDDDLDPDEDREALKAFREEKIEFERDIECLRETDWCEGAMRQ